VRLLLAFPFVLALVAATASAQPTPAEPPTAGEALFVLSGRGWGHGVGMGQYGAAGMANAGRTYEQILAHYYTGTEVGRAGTKQVRILLAEGRRAVSVSSAVPYSVVDGNGQTYRIKPGALQLNRNLVLPKALLLPEDEARRVKVAPPLVVRAGKVVPLALDGRLYRGQLEIVVEKTFLRVVNVVPLETYLQGVVAGEMPHMWPMEALKAQAVAARSYALATRVKGKPFDHYSDPRSQVYLGVAGEKSRTNEAVRATAGKVVLYGGQVATTYYFSTSGGRTASAADVFGFSVPYLVSRPDPWDAASPHHSWGPILVGARTLQAKLNAGDRVLDAFGVATPSGRLRSLLLETGSGSTTVPATVMRASLGLRSTWVTVGVLRLDQPRGSVVFGAEIVLTGIARGLPSPRLSSSPDGRAGWTDVGRLSRAASGAVSLAIAPTRTARYRIEVEGAASPAVLVQVAPRVQLQVPGDPRTLTGFVRPRLKGAQVTVERRRGAMWEPLVETTVDGTGAFRARFNGAPGSYRARVPKTGSWAEGIAPVLEVPG
jgi:stage II sporulation protein D